jgi:hypothetical protein
MYYKKTRELSMFLEKANVGKYGSDEKRKKAQTNTTPNVFSSIHHLQIQD